MYLHANLGHKTNPLNSSQTLEVSVSNFKQEFSLFLKNSHSTVYRRVQWPPEVGRLQNASRYWPEH